MFGFIYVRRHASYENTCKLGKSKNIYGRDFQYATGELRRGRFERVYKIPLKKMDILERLLQNEFKNYNVRYDGGIEFYDIKIIELIELYFQRLNLKYEKLTNIEIDNIEKLYRVRKPFIKFLKIIKKVPFSFYNIKNITRPAVPIKTRKHTQIRFMIYLTGIDNVYCMYGPKKF